MRIFVTGATGFVGQYLMPELSRRWPNAILSGVGSELDLLDIPTLEREIKDFQPSHVIHLGGLASVPESFNNPLRAYQVNTIGSANFFETLYRFAPEALVLAVGSADAYGRSFASGKALDEQAVFAPLNPYAASKAAAEMIAMEYAQRGLRIIRLRPFNHTGPGQSDGYVVSSFARQVAAIQMGLEPPVMRVGSLSPERDFTDVRDIVAAYVHVLKIAEELEPGTALNIGSGQARTIQSILDELVGLSGVNIDILPDPARMRSVDIPCVRANTNKIKMLGWGAQISWEQTLSDLLGDWSRRLIAHRD